MVWYSGTYGWRRVTFGFMSLAIYRYKSYNGRLVALAVGEDDGVSQKKYERIAELGAEIR